jgi:4'-phosphopantetheinyl transferase EntD
LASVGLADLLPNWVVVVEASDTLLPEPLLLEEEAALGEVVATRRAEFTIGRHCAHRALRALGADLGPILSGPAREPMWPAGIVGSITHCPGFCAAAVAWRIDAASVGIDAEFHAALPAGVLAEVATPDENRALGVLPDVGIYWDRVLFSAKESVFKAWYPIASAWIGFADVRLAIEPGIPNPGRGTFSAKLVGHGIPGGGHQGPCHSGRYSIEDQRVLTALVMPAGPA